MSNKTCVCNNAGLCLFCLTEQQARTAALEPPPTPKLESGAIVRFTYRNHRGEISQRRAVFLRIDFRSTPYHSKPQYILHGVDLDKGAERGFALKDILGWID